VARPWRLRHKLLLGVGLVVGSVALLVAGTVQGLWSYVGTMNTTDSKLSELLALDELRPELAQMNAILEAGGEKEPIAFRESLGRFADKFERYKERFRDTVARQRDPDPYTDTQLSADIDATLGKLRQAMQRNLDGQAIGESFGRDKNFMRQYDRLTQLTDELRGEISTDMFRRTDQARKLYKHSVWWIGAATGLSGLLLLLLVSFFFHGVFRPIRQLQRGVDRVKAGDFSKPIALKSGDELEDLAAAFDSAAAELHETQRDLQEKVKERSRQLVRSERIASVGFLAAGVAHEINNPLASIVFCSEAVQGRVAEQLENIVPAEREVILKYLQMIHQEAFRCKKITAKLLDFSRQGDRRREATDLVELIQGVLEMAQHLQNCHGKRMIFEPRSRVSAEVNGQDLKSVVLNLVVNALDSMEQGGVLTVTLAQTAEYAEVGFRDTGCGMTPEVLANIFEPFFTRSRTGRGTGLGLFISHQIIDQHDGEISVESAGPGRGSTFAVRLPLKARQTDTAEAQGANTLAFPVARTAPEETGLGHAA
jgi:signal transduction histidine kinase